MSEFWFDRAERKHRRLLFQSLMDKVPTTQYISRTEKDDEDLNNVLNALEEDDYSVWNADAPNDFETPISQTATKWPSSDSGELNGTIPRYEFRSWLRLVLLSRLHPTGDVRWRRELEAVSDSVLDCFEADSGRNGISWQIFDKALADPLVRTVLSSMNLTCSFTSNFCILVSPKCLNLLFDLPTSLQARCRYQVFHNCSPLSDTSHQSAANLTKNSLLRN